MPTIATVRAAIQATLSGVADIGVVHDYERWAARTDAFTALYLSATHGQIRGWYIRQLSRSERSPDVGRHAVIARWRLGGYMALDDSAQSEKTFDDLVEDVIDAFRADDTLGGTVDTCVVGDIAGLQLEQSGPVMFGGVLCHGAQLGLQTRWFL